MSEINQGNPKVSRRSTDLRFVGNIPKSSANTVRRSLPANYSPLRINKNVAVEPILMPVNSYLNMNR